MMSKHFRLLVIFDDSIFRRLDSRSIFLLDNGVNVYIYVGSNSNPSIIKNVFGKLHLKLFLKLNFPKLYSAGKNSVNEIPDVCFSLPNLETPSNEALHEFLNALNEEKPYNPTLQIIR
jgi:Gelsolin repeat